MELKDIAPVALTIVLAGVIISVGINILYNAQQDLGYQYSTIATGVNLTAITFTAENTCTDFAQMDYPDQKVTNITTIGNGTQILPEANWTIAPNGSCMYIVCDDDAWKLDSDWVPMDPTFVEQSDYAYDSYENASMGGAELASWLPTIALIVAAAIVIGVVMRMFRVPGSE